jgi:hypothetical protein
LTEAERFTLRKYYNCQQQDEQITGLLASYIALLHLCGHEALNNDPAPIIEKLDAWTIMRSASNDVYRVLKRDGEAVICPRLGTRKGCKSGL